MEIHALNVYIIRLYIVVLNTVAHFKVICLPNFQYGSKTSLTRAQL